MAVRYVVEMVGYDTEADDEVTLLFAKGQSISFTDHAPAASGLLLWESVSQAISVRGGTVVSEGDGGEIIIANAPRDISEAGPWDHLANWRWRGMVASLYRVPGRVWANRVLEARALMEQPVANIDEGTITFPLRDPRAELDAPLLTQKYAGDNVAPLGFEGDEELKGKTKPLVIGPVSNQEPDLVNKSKLIYQLSVAPGTVLCLRDGGVPLTAGTIRGSQASMEANAPAEGEYDIYSGAEGLFVRLGASVLYRLTFDATTGAAEADRTHAQVWKTLRTTYCGADAGDIDDDSVDDVDAAAPHEAGFFLRDESRRDAIDRVLGSLSGYERQNVDGSWSIGRLEQPEGAAVVRLMVASPDSEMIVTDRALTRIARARPSWAADGVPPYRVNVRWGLNNTVMGPGDFAGSAATRLREKFKEVWRVETATDAGIWDPTDDSGDFPGAPELTVETGYQPGDDGRTCPHAEEEARRLLSLYSDLSGPFEVGFKPVLKTGYSNVVLVGQPVKLTYAGHDLEEGPLFVCLQSKYRVEAGKSLPEIGLLLGVTGPDVLPYMVLLMGFDDQVDESQVFIDESAYARTVVAGGNYPDRPKIDTGEFRYGDGSFESAQASFIYADPATELEFGANPFSIDAWVRWDDVDGVLQHTTGVMQWGNQTVNTHGWALRRNGEDVFGFAVSADNDTYTEIDGAFTPIEGQWHHFRVTRDPSGYIRVFADGTMIAKDYFADTITLPPEPEWQAFFVLRVGAWIDLGFQRCIVGNLDEVRVVNGISVWSKDASFTPPTRKFARP
jgi:hypothetical protein